MELKPADIKRILKDRPNAAIVEAGKAMNRKLSVHIAGIGMDTYLEKINSFENEDQKKVRQRYARSNVDLFDRLFRPIDEVFSARGGSTYIDLPDTQKRQLESRLASVEWGYPLRKWIDNVARPAYLMDPMGLIFIEVAKGDSYPTYKGICEVYDYQMNGRFMDYVVFCTKDKDVYRVVDDRFDALYRFDGDQVRAVRNETYPNYFGHVPAMIVSDLLKPGTSLMASPAGTVVDLADEYLRECSVKSVLKLYHGFPKYWQYITSCSECRGEGLVDGKDCPTCAGTGRKLRYDVADTINMPIPATGDPKLAPDIAGYVTPDIKGLDSMTAELKLLESLMERTVWGTHRSEEAKNDTATGRFIDVQPVNRRLTKFSEWGEGVEKFVIEEMGRFFYPKSFGGASVNYGRRYLIEGPDEVWKKYSEARKDGAPQATLDEMLQDYYQTKYSQDGYSLRKHLQLMKVEPFVHLTIQEAKGVAEGTPDYKMKLYFTEWASTLPEGDAQWRDVDYLRKSLAAYVVKKETPAEPVRVSVGFSKT